MRKRYLTNEQDIEIQQLYIGGLSTVKISKLFEVCSDTISTSLRRTGTKARTREEACTKYTLNSSFFDSVDNEEKAYWLGFITADGGIVGHQLVLSLKAADTCHIEAFRKALGSTHPIKNVMSVINEKEIWQPRLVISSVKLVKALKNLGVVENKSFTVKPPQRLSNTLQIAYWRGYFDGDGHISNHPTYRAAEVTGNIYILKGFAAFLQNNLNLKSKITKDKSVYRIRYGKRLSVYLVAKLLYSNSSVHLKRKYEVAKTIFQDDFFYLRKNSKYRKSTCSSLG